VISLLEEAILATDLALYFKSVYLNSFIILCGCTLCALSYCVQCTMCVLCTVVMYTLCTVYCVAIHCHIFSPVVSDLIAYMANLSFSQGTFPSKFMHASVTPLLKKPGLNPSVSANFRPISNLNSISKILERLFLHVCNHIMLSHLTSILFSKPIANITQLKPL